MAVYVIAGPDGREFEVNAPDDATEAEVLAYAEANFPAAKTPKEAPKPTPLAEHGKQAASEQSFLENLGAGFGGAMKGFGLGAQQLIPGMKGPTPEEVAEWKAQMEGLRSSWGGGLGEAAGYTAAALPAAMASSSVPVAAASSAALGALTPAESISERGKNIAVSAGAGALGQKIGNTISSRMSKGPISNANTDETLRHIKAAEDIGMEFTPGQKTGSPRLFSFERGMAQSPVASAPFDKMAEHNQRVVNRAFAKAIGEDADEVGTQTLSNAHTRLGSIFDAARDDTQVFLNKGVANKLNKINKDYSHLIDPASDFRLPNRLADMVNAQGATREELGALSTQLRQKAESLISSPQGDRNMARALFEVRELVEDQIQKSLSPKEAKLYKQARQQYRNLMTGMASGALNESSGNVSAATLGRALSRKAKSDFVFAGNDSDLLRVAHAARAVKPLTGGSDTAAKKSAMDYVRTLGPAAGIGAGGAIAGGSTLGPLGALGGAYLAERIVPSMYLGAGRFLSSPHPQLGRAAGVAGRALAPVGGLTAIKTTQ